jgi:hypothetical protein
MHVLTRRDDAGAARCKADSGIRFVEREALGTAKAEEGRMKADGRALDQADVFRLLPDRGLEGGEAGRAGLTRIRAPATRRPLLAVSARSLPG